MAEGNEFQQQADNENKRVQSEQITAILETVRTLVEEVKAVKKELRTARGELRNLDKLRPLRSTVEEEAEEVEEPTDQK